MELMNRLRLKVLLWLCPGVLVELDRLRHFSEAIHDLHMVPLPYTEETLEMAFQNVKAMEPDAIAGKATVQDRQASLMEIYRRGKC